MRIRLTVSYRGTRYAGWQVQPQAITVQGELQAVVSRLCDEPVKVTGAGRTDAGVHALGQVCHFDAPKRLEIAAWRHAFDRLLPDDIRVVDCREVAADFHARYGARRKTYRYHIDTAAIASPFLAPFSWHRPGIVDRRALREAAAQLVGPVNQTVFAAQSDAGREIRDIDSVALEEDRLLVVTVRGRSFLRHAVRGMVGSLLEVGYGRRSPDDIAAMAARRPGHPPMVKAPPQGLFLAFVAYDREPLDAC